MSDSIPHRVRVSEKARYVRLRMTMDAGLEVVVPRGYNLQKIAPLLEQKRNWIESTQRRFEKYKADFPPQPVEKLPDQITLDAIGETWRVEYIETKTSMVRLHQHHGNRLVVSGNIISVLACQRVLRRWLCRRGQEVLIPWLRQVSSEVGLPFSKGSVKIQKSRWGSCSRHKTISVNAKLLFLRPELVRYLFIHELCHTVHMNHSDAYWKFVALKVARYRELDAEMRPAGRAIPRWVTG